MREQWKAKKGDSEELFTVNCVPFVCEKLHEVTGIIFKPCLFP